VGGVSLWPGRFVWIDNGATVGREQSGRRPWLVVSSVDFLKRTDDLVTVVPCSSRDRGWVHHVELVGETGLRTRTFAITEQIRTVSRQRIVGAAGTADPASVRATVTWVSAWLHRAA
jgi:mRNA interferase MazF